MRLNEENSWNAAIYALEYLNDSSLLKKLIAKAKADEKDSVDILKDEPTIEAEQVRHGRWVEYPRGSGIYCSECHKRRRYKDIYDDYCPKCGAKVDGKEEES